MERDSKCLTTRQLNRAKGSNAREDAYVRKRLVMTHRCRMTRMT